MVCNGEYESQRGHTDSSTPLAWRKEKETEFQAPLTRKVVGRHSALKNLARFLFLRRAIKGKTPAQEVLESKAGESRFYQLHELCIRYYTVAPVISDSTVIGDIPTNLGTAQLKLRVRQFSIKRPCFGCRVRRHFDKAKRTNTS